MKNLSGYGRRAAKRYMRIFLHSPFFVTSLVHRFFGGVTGQAPSACGSWDWQSASSFPDASRVIKFARKKLRSEQLSRHIKLPMAPPDMADLHSNIDTPRSVPLGGGNTRPDLKYS